MRFYNQRHKFYCGIDLYARKIYVCILDAPGNTKLLRNLEPTLHCRLMPTSHTLKMSSSASNACSHGTRFPIFAAST